MRIISRAPVRRICPSLPGLIVTSQPPQTPCDRIQSSIDPARPHIALHPINCVPSCLVDFFPPPHHVLGSPSLRPAADPLLPSYIVIQYGWAVCVAKATPRLTREGTGQGVPTALAGWSRSGVRRSWRSWGRRAIVAVEALARLSAPGRNERRGTWPWITSKTLVRLTSQGGRTTPATTVSRGRYRRTLNSRDSQYPACIN